MDLAISAVTGDLASRFVSFLVNKYLDHICLEEKVQRLQQLLLRVCMVIEEADGRYITNSCMLIQLKTLAAAMYKGYHLLDNIMYMQQKEVSKELVSDSSSASTPFTRSRAIGSAATNKVIYPEFHSTLQNLEAVVANMAEFAVLLGGCQRISSRKPYDAYLYIDNFMFGRHVEKQQITSFLLQHNSTNGRPPAVLPVVGSSRGVGKKTLVAHVCGDERVHSHFPVILHLNGDDLLKIPDREKLPGRTLVIVEFVSEVDKDDWALFYSSVTRMERGTKVIIIGQNENLEDFGTTKPISLNCMAFEEYRYLFKILSLGSANPIDHPGLVPMVEEFANLLGGSLISANVLADALRKNLNTQFWLYRLNGVRDTIKKNISCFGAHPNVLFDRGHPRHLLSHYILSPAAPSCRAPSASSMTNVPKKDLPTLIFGDLIAAAGHMVVPEGDFSLTSWESRLPPYASFVHLVHFAPCRADDKPETPLSGKKRRGLFA